MTAGDRIHRGNSVGIGAVIVAMVVVAMSMPLRAEAPSEAAAKFEQRCYSCHNIGGGNKQGPDLKGVTDRRSKEWLHRFIPSPAGMNRSGDPVATELFSAFAPQVMPDQALTPEEIDLILTFIADLTKRNENFVPAGARLARRTTPADIEAGRDLFTGRASLSGGAPPCISCHDLEGIGGFGGGTLGPDLTISAVRYTDPELIAILQNPNFPTMASIFARRPLSDEEIVRFFALITSVRPAGLARSARQGAIMTDYTFPLSGLAAFVVAMIAMSLVWRRRLDGVREHVVRRSIP